MEFIHDRINYPYFTREDLERTVGKRLNKGTPSASTIKSELLDGIYFNNKTMEHYTKKAIEFRTALVSWMAEEATKPQQA